MIAKCGRRLSKQQQPLSTLFLRQKDTSVVEKTVTTLSSHFSTLLMGQEGQRPLEGGLALLPIFCKSKK
jgi:hypothetical protein